MLSGGATNFVSITGSGRDSLYSDLGDVKFEYRKE
jgi:hypothetical protein